MLNALLAVGVSMLTILLYIAFRFEFGFGDRRHGLHRSTTS